MNEQQRTGMNSRMLEIDLWQTADCRTSFRWRENEPTICGFTGGSISYGDAVREKVNAHGKVILVSDTMLRTLLVSPGDGEDGRERSPFIMCSSRADLVAEMKRRVELCGSRARMVVIDLDTTSREFTPSNLRALGGKGHNPIAYR